MKRLFYGGRILTLASPLYAEAMLVEDGRILRTGDYSSLCEGLAGEVQKIDLGGRVIMPSFIDAHGHYNSIAAPTLDCSVRGACSIEEIKARVDAYIKKEASVQESGSECAITTKTVCQALCTRHFASLTTSVPTDL